MKIKLLENNNEIKIPFKNIKGITLLSVKEARKLPKDILAIDEWWWLRSPGKESRRVAAVEYDGFIDNFGDYVEDDQNVVRPSLQILNLESSNFKIGDIVECLGLKWYYVGKNEDTGDVQILSIRPIGKYCFNANVKKPNVNKFEGSDIQKYLQNWLKERLSEYKEKFKIDAYKNNKLIDSVVSNDIEEITEEIDNFISDGCDKVVFYNDSNGKEVTLTKNDFKE